MALIRRGYELFAAGDFEAVAELLAEDAELPDTAGLGLADSSPGTRHGPEGFLRAIEESQELFDDYGVEPEGFLDAGESVIVPVHISGRGKVSGAAIETRVVHLWLLRDRKVIRNEIYRTVDEALQAAGRAG